MIRNELIQRITKSAGVPESEANSFFEIFAHKAYDLLENQQTLKIPDIGHIKFDTDDEIKLIFSPDIYFKENEILDFYLSQEVIKNYAVEYAFSPSTSESLIPLDEEIEDDFFYQPFGTELQTLVQDKAEDFLNSLNVIDEEQLESADVIVEEKTDETPADTALSKSVEEETTEEKLEKIDPEFLEKISEEESLPESLEKEEDLEETHEIQEFEVINGKEIPEDIEKEEIVEEDKLEITEEENDEQTLETEEENKIDEKLEAHELNEFKEDIEEDVFNVENKSSDIAEEPEIENVEDKEELEASSEDIEGYELVNPVIPDLFSDKYQPIQMTDLFDDYKDLDDPVHIDENGFSEVMFRHIDEQSTASHDEAAGTGKVRNRIRRKKIERRRSKAPIFILALLVLIIGAAVVYKTLLSIPHKAVPVNITQATKFVPSKPKIISRNFDIAVNYPYNKEENPFMFEPIDASILDNNSTISQKTYTEAPKNINNTKAASITTPADSTSNMSIEDWENAKAIPADTYKQVDNYIYTDGKIYFVQVSSWKILSQALEQKRKLEAKGYKVSIEKLTSPRGYDYYIDKIGNFNSLKEAKDYLKSH
jgi:cell division septation protein DedD